MFQQSGEFTLRRIQTEILNGENAHVLFSQLSRADFGKDDARLRVMERLDYYFACEVWKQLYLRSVLPCLRSIDHL